MPRYVRGCRRPLHRCSELFRATSGRPELRDDNKPQTSQTSTQISATFCVGDREWVSGVHGHALQPLLLPKPQAVLGRAPLHCPSAVPRAATTKTMQSGLGLRAWGLNRAFLKCFFVPSSFQRLLLRWQVPPHLPDQEGRAGEQSSRHIVLWDQEPGKEG